MYRTVSGQVSEAFHAFTHAHTKTNCRALEARWDFITYSCTPLDSPLLVPKLLKLDILFDRVSVRVVCEGIGAGKPCSLAYMRASEHALAGRKLRCSVLETHHNQRN